MEINPHYWFNLRRSSMKLIAGGSTCLLLFLWVLQFPPSSTVAPRPVLRTSPLTKELEDKKALYYFRKEPLKLPTNPSTASSVPRVNLDTSTGRSDEDPSQQSPAEDRIFWPKYKYPFWGLPYGVYGGGPFGPGGFGGPLGPGPFGPPFHPVPLVPPPVTAGVVTTEVIVGGPVGGAAGGAGGAGGAAAAGAPGSGSGPGPPSGPYYGWSGGRHRKRKKPQPPEPDEELYDYSYKPPSKMKPSNRKPCKHGSGAGGQAPVSKPPKYKLPSVDVPPSGCKYGKGPRCQKKYPIRQPEPDPVYLMDDDAGVVDDYAIGIDDYPQPGHMDYPSHPYYMYPFPSPPVTSIHYPVAGGYVDPLSTPPPVPPSPVPPSPVPPSPVIDPGAIVPPALLNQYFAPVTACSTPSYQCPSSSVPVPVGASYSITPNAPSYQGPSADTPVPMGISYSITPNTPSYKGPAAPIPAPAPLVISYSMTPSTPSYPAPPPATTPAPVGVSYSITPNIPSKPAPPAPFLATEGVSYSITPNIPSKHVPPATIPAPVGVSYSITPNAPISQVQSTTAHGQVGRNYQMKHNSSSNQVQHVTTTAQMGNANLPPPSFSYRSKQVVSDSNTPTVAASDVVYTYILQQSDTTEQPMITHSQSQPADTYRSLSKEVTNAHKTQATFSNYPGVGQHYMLLPQTSSLESYGMIEPSFTTSTTQMMPHTSSEHYITQESSLVSYITPAPSADMVASPQPSSEPCITPQPSARLVAPPQPSSEPCITLQPSTRQVVSPQPSSEPCITLQPSARQVASPQPSSEPCITPQPPSEPCTSPQPSSEPLTTPQPSSPQPSTELAESSPSAGLASPQPSMGTKLATQSSSEGTLVQLSPSTAPDPVSGVNTTSQPLPNAQPIDTTYTTHKPQKVAVTASHTETSPPKLPKAAKIQETSPQASIEPNLQPSTQHQRHSQPYTIPISPDIQIQILPPDSSLQHLSYYTTRDNSNEPQYHIVYHNNPTKSSDKPSSSSRPSEGHIDNKIDSESTSFINEVSKRNQVTVQLNPLFDSKEYKSTGASLSSGLYRSFNDELMGMPFVRAGYEAPSSSSSDLEELDIETTTPVNKNFDSISNNYFDSSVVSSAAELRARIALPYPVVNNFNKVTTDGSKYKKTENNSASTSTGSEVKETGSNSQTSSQNKKADTPSFSDNITERPDITADQLTTESMQFSISSSVSNNSHRFHV